ncbi:hypothetical protein CANARDRAFT_8004 [[Candida] arabinofermentans NRRL YB-2248]|uniref:E3 ubiquitin-protein ligase n=1 Tax=[Candida] arabinofermentans NRRL YB-2248 TaxID=983967 RepID=A0A1E4SZD0_9ASCO|nr:hypothetical protein CANARDRAFT_8004 [[Candida] arabinofermentans NRRL YB-2248]
MMIPSDQDLAQRLRQTLVQLPKQFDYATTPDLITTLNRSLYFLVTSEGKYYDFFFPGVRKTRDFPSQWSDVPIHDNTGNISKGRFYLHQKKSKNKSHVGRICSRKIKIGKPVYSCKDCALDPTCCLCDDCFNKEEHLEHNVSMHASSGSAICDCGDATSWHKELNCLACIQSENDEAPDLPTVMNDNIRIIVRVLLDYVLDVQSATPYTVPFTHQYNKSSPYSLMMKKFSDLSNLPIQKYGIEDSNSDAYCLVLWNDELHSWESAQRCIGAAINKTGEDKQCFDLATQINAVGRATLSTSKDVSSLLDAFTNVQAEDLVATINSSRDLARDEICEEIFTWFKRCIDHPNNKVSDCFRNAISEALFETYVSEREVVDQEQLIYNGKQETMGLLSLDFKIPILNGTSLRDPVSLRALRAKGIELFQPSNTGGVFSISSRLQYLFYLEIRLWKRLRISLRDMLIPLLTTNYHSRKELFVHIVEVLPVLEYIQAKVDREWQLSLLDHVRLQTYYDPNIGTDMLESGKLIGVFRSLVNVFHFNADSNSKYNPMQGIRSETSRLISAESATLNGVESLMGYIKPGSEAIVKPEYLLHLMMIFGLFQESSTIKRKTGAHVETENSSYKIYFMRAHQAYQISKYIGKIVSGINVKSKPVENSIAILASFLDSSSRAFNNEKNIVEHDVADTSSSFLHPLHSLLTEICSNYKFFEIGMLSPKVLSVKLVENTVDLDENEESSPDMLAIADDVLQSVVLSSQIRSRFWIRNGYQPLNEESTNRALFNLMGELHLNQLSILAEPSYKRSLLNIFDRFGFLDCIVGTLSFDETIYEERIYSILNDCIDFFYHVLTYREPFDSNLTYEDKEYMKIKHSICAVLCVEPTKYSALKKMVDESPYFDKALAEVSNYQAPSGINDYGQYVLRPEIYSEMDFLNLYYNFYSADDIENSLLANIAKIKKKKEEEICLQPKIYQLNDTDRSKISGIGDCLRIPLFVKFIYKVLRHAIESSNEQCLPHLLHLIHAIVLDANLDDKGIDNFSDIPICNLLLTLIQKEDTSKQIIKTASVLLEALLLKDDNILQALIDGFGIDHINEFKKSPHGKNLETKKERTKRLALKRQQKIMQKMHKQQSAFIEKNKEYFDDKPEVDSPTGKDVNMESTPEVETRTCILCRNDEDGYNLFGIPVLISDSTVFWNIPSSEMGAPPFMIPGFPPTNTNSKKRKWQTREGEDQCLGSSCVRSKDVITSCAHGMHYRCFKGMIIEKSLTIGKFTCPLCESFCNGFVPSYTFPDFELDPSEDLKAATWQQIFQEREQDNLASLTNLVFDKKLLRMLSDPNKNTFKQFALELNELTKVNNSISSVCKSAGDDHIEATRNSLSLLLGSTIEQLEIASRYDGSSKLTAPYLQTLRSLIQYKALINYLPFETEKKFAEYKDSLYAAGGGFMSDNLLLFLQGNESIETIVRLNLTKAFIKVIFSSLYRFQNDSSSLMIDSILSEKPSLDENIKTTMISLTKRCAANLFKTFIDEVDPIFYKEDLVERMYWIAVNIFRNYYKQLKLMSAVLNISEFDFGSVDQLLLRIKDVRSLEYSVSSQLATSADRFSSTVNGLVLDYPSIVHLAPLPEKMSGFLKMDGFGLKKASDATHVCVFCGGCVCDPFNHIDRCEMNKSSICLFFSPSVNVLDLKEASGSFVTASMTLESPYLNKHGEPAGGLIGAGESGVLNLERYKNLNRMWMSQGLNNRIYKRFSGSTRRIRVATGQGMNNTTTLPFILPQTPGFDLANVIGLAGIPTNAVFGTEPMLTDEEEDDGEEDEEDRGDDDDDEDGITDWCFYSTVVHTFFKRNSIYVGTVLAGAFAFQGFFDVAVTQWYENRNKGKLWKDVKLQLAAAGGDDDEEEDDE